MHDFQEFFDGNLLIIAGIDVEGSLSRLVPGFLRDVRAVDAMVNTQV